MRDVHIIIVCLLCSISLNAQVLSGPWVGNVGLRTASVWLEPGPAINKIEIHYHPDEKDFSKIIRSPELLPGREFNPLKVDLGGLKPSTTYKYVVKLFSGKRVYDYAGSFTTKELWQYRRPAPDFSFLAGSCAYFNEPVYDRPGKPYGGDSTIFLVMARENAAFNLWLGDSWYYREADFTPWGMYYRAQRDRAQEVLQPLLRKMPQYYVWDDHDYGPNNSGREYIYKAESRKVFMEYTLNPSYGEKGEGIYTTFSESDVDFFLTDVRSFRSQDLLSDSTSKKFFGESQMEWLKNSLLRSRATFKIIVSGSQVLNPVSTQDCFRHYKKEFAELMEFLNTQKIPGVIFLSGDRHHSEIIKHEGVYTFYDVTVSPLTSGVSTARENEKLNPSRVGPLIREQNYARISVAGNTGERKLRIDFINKVGTLIYSWQVTQKELKAAP